MAETMILEVERQEVPQLEIEETKDANEQSKDIEQRIRERAYQLFVERGFEHGCDTEDWLQAEAEVTSSIYGD